MTWFPRRSWNESTSAQPLRLNALFITLLCVLEPFDNVCRALDRLLRLHSNRLYLLNLVLQLLVQSDRLLDQLVRLKILRSTLSYWALFPSFLHAVRNRVAHQESHGLHPFLGTNAKSLLVRRVVLGLDGSRGRVA